MDVSASISAMRNDGIGILVFVFIVGRLYLFCSPHGNDKMTLRDQIHREFVYRPLQFHKRSPDFIGMHNEPPSVVVRVSNPDCSPLGINR
jgi:hypothetical protein